MLALVPAPLHRVALRIAHRLRLAWWRLRGGDLHGCNALVFDGRGAVLLIRHSYHAPERWMLPGGGMRRGEPAAEAAVREVFEETGCRMLAPRPFAVDLTPLAGCRDHVHLVAGHTSDLPRPDGREIIAAHFFSLADLPGETSDTALRRIARWRSWREQPASPPGDQLHGSSGSTAGTSGDTPGAPA
jgi:8-oxo-dGTP pyrophosphatase MutT (NUDIX family)